MNHNYHDREDDLLHCKVCNGGEGSLPTDCPGQRMTPEQDDAVMAGQLDYRNGVWETYYAGAWAPAPTATLGGWLITTSPDSKYLYVQRDGCPGQIHIKADDEGFVVDIWSDDDTPEVCGSAAATYSELEPE